MELTPDFQKSYTESAAATSVKLAKLISFEGKNGLNHCAPVSIMLP
jgi:hypothetical protein